MQMSKRSPWSLSLLLLTVTALASGCASTRRDAYIQDKASQYVYRKPIAEVWPQVRALLQEKELPLREAPGAYEIGTDWTMLGSPSSLGTSYVRYLVRGKQPSPVSCSVEILRQNRTQSGEGPAGNTGNDSSSMTRDREMEWELLQRVDPEGAKALLEEAKTAIK